jgi:hypothetical protein
MEPFSETEMEGTSVHSSVARDEAGPSHQGRDEAGPSHEGRIFRNASLESSMRNRIVRLEQENSPYLLDKAKGAYWSDIKRELGHAPSQREYDRLVTFENRDLLLREQKHEALRLFQGILEQNPPLADQAPYNPQEVFKDFLDEYGDQLDRVGRIPTRHVGTRVFSSGKARPQKGWARLYQRTHFLESVLTLTAIYDAIRGE